MKIFIILAALVCVAHCKVEIAQTTKEVYNRVWNDDGLRIVTFGYQRCAKSMKSFSQLENFIKNSKTCGDVDYVFADCVKAQPGTCRGLYDNYLDFLPLEQRLKIKEKNLRYPRTFLFKQEGEKALVVPISYTGRMKASLYNDQDHFDEWCGEARNREVGFKQD